MNVHRLLCTPPMRKASWSAPFERTGPIPSLRGVSSGAFIATAVIMGVCVISGCSDLSQQAGSIGTGGSVNTKATGQGGTSSSGNNTGVGGGVGGTIGGKPPASGTTSTAENVPSGGFGGIGGAQETGGTAIGGSTTTGGSSSSASNVGGTKAPTGGAAAGGATAGRAAAGEAAAGRVGAGGNKAAAGTTFSSGGAKASGGSPATAGGKATAGTGATGTSACNPTDKKPDPTPVSFTNPGSPPSGPYQITIEQDPGISDHTVYRPTDLGATKLPIIAWGEGGCVKNGTKDFAEILSEFTSYGFLILADGPPNGTGATGSGSGSDGTPLIKAIDWAIAENQRPCSQYYQKLDTSKVAVMGQSCGGLMAYAAAGDPRVTTVVAVNSGLMSADQKIYDSLHAPMAIIDGGSDDIAYANGSRDFGNINSIPLLFANYPYGHTGWFSKDNAGEFGKAGVAWLRWQLLGDDGTTGKGMFLGASCGLCSNSSWTIQQKNLK